MCDDSLPDLFVTITEDEFSCPAVAGIQHVLHTIDKNLSWRQASVECSRVFAEKIDTLMRDYICNKNVNLLGRVREYVVSSARWFFRRKAPIYITMPPAWAHKPALLVPACLHHKHTHHPLRPAWHGGQA